MSICSEIGRAHLFGGLGRLSVDHRTLARQAAHLLAKVSTRARIA